MLDYNKFKKHLQTLQKKRVNKLMQNPRTADSRDVDSANIALLLRISQVVQIMKLIMNIVFLSFFTGLFWYIYCIVTQENVQKMIRDKDPEEQTFL